MLQVLDLVVLPHVDHLERLAPVRVVRLVLDARRRTLTVLPDGACWRRTFGFGRSFRLCGGSSVPPLEKRAKRSAPILRSLFSSKSLADKERTLSSPTSKFRFLRTKADQLDCSRRAMQWTHSSERHSSQTGGFEDGC